MSKVFVNGTFDILHHGHLELLKFAKSCGDFLIVGIDSDDRIKQKKGFDRPINNMESRMEMLLALKYVNQVRVFYSDIELEQLVKSIEPDIMIVGSDWEDKPVIGSKYAKKLIFFDRIDGYSTTNIIKRASNW